MPSIKLVLQGAIVALVIFVIGAALIGNYQTFAEEERKVKKQESNCQRTQISRRFDVYRMDCGHDGKIHTFYFKHNGGVSNIIVE